MEVFTAMDVWLYTCKLLIIAALFEYAWILRDVSSVVIFEIVKSKGIYIGIYFLNSAVSNLCTLVKLTLNTKTEHSTDPNPRMRMKGHLRRENDKKTKNSHHHTTRFDVASARIDQKAFTVFLIFFMAFCVLYFVFCLSR